MREECLAENIGPSLQENVLLELTASKIQRAQREYLQIHPKVQTQLQRKYIIEPISQETEKRNVLTIANPNSHEFIVGI